MTLTRRALFGGFAGLLAAPAIVKASSLMAVKPVAVAPTYCFLRSIYVTEAGVFGLAELIDNVVPTDMPVLRWLEAQKTPPSA